MKLVLLEKVKDALAEQLRHDADVVVVSKSVDEMDAFAARRISLTLVFCAFPRLHSLDIVRVSITQSSKHSNLNLGGIGVLLNRPDDLDGHLSIPQSILASHYLPKCALTE